MMIFVAEHIMGFKHGKCAGSQGGANINSGGTSESWFYCDWCGQRVSWYRSIPPCPRYPFPEFSFIDLMRRLGKNGVPIIVRYDALRKSKNFTIIGPEGRICDTDQPLEELCQYLWDEYSEDAILISSGILERLKARAQQQKPSANWEQVNYMIEPDSV